MLSDDEFKEVLHYPNKYNRLIPEKRYDVYVRVKDIVARDPRDQTARMLLQRAEREFDPFSSVLANLPPGMMDPQMTGYIEDFLYNPDTDIESFIQSVCHHRRFWSTVQPTEEAFKYAARFGCSDLVFYLLGVAESSARFWKTIMQSAAEGGHISLVWEIFKWYGDTPISNREMKSLILDSLTAAARTNQRNMIDFLISDLYTRVSEWEDEDEYEDEDEDEDEDHLHHLYNSILYGAAQGGHLELVDQAIKNGAYDYVGGAIHAVRGGHAYLVKHLLNAGPHFHPVLMSTEQIDEIMDEAARVGDIDTVEYMVELGAVDYDLAMASAAANGHDEIVQYMFDLGASNYNWTLWRAAAGGYFSIVDLIIELAGNIHPLDYNRAMEEAAEAGQLDMVDYMVELGADAYGLAFDAAASVGNVHVMEYLLEYVNQQNLNNALILAIEYSQEDAAEFALRNGANNFVEALELAEGYGHYNIPNIIRSYM